MIIYKQGNIFEEDLEALVNPVNCVGVMGAGLALQFKNRYPDNYKFYVKAWKDGQFESGDIFCHILEGKGNPKFILNFPTKRHWRDPSKIEYIQEGLQTLAVSIQLNEIKSIGIPALGCGLGGLDWKDVKPLMDEHLSVFDDVKIIVFEPIEK